MSERPRFVIRSADVSEEEGAYPPPFDQEKMSFGRDLGRAAGSRTLGAVRDRIPPGRRTSFAHAHLREEEVVYVLAGRPSLRWIEPGQPAREVELAPGDFASFPASTAIAHTFVNHTGEDVELLVVGERRPSDRVCYPEEAELEDWWQVHRPMRAWPDAAGPRGMGRSPAVLVETPRLIVRPWTVDDAHDLVDAQTRNQDHLREFMPWAQTLPTVDEMAERISGWQRGIDGGGDDIVYGVFLPDGRIVGGTGLHDRIGALGREIGYWVDREHEGRGLVSEWTSALVQLAFRGMDIDRVEIHCEPRNVRSAAVPRRLGFVHEATLPRRALGSGGQPEDTMIWTLYRSGFDTSPCAAVPVKAWDRLGRRIL